MKWVGRTLAVFLVMGIVPLFVVAACNFAFAQTMINPETYRTAFANPDIFNDLLPVTLPAIIDAAATQDSDTATQGALAQISLGAIGERVARENREAWQEITNLLIPPEWLENQFNQVIDILFGVIEGDFAALETSMDLTEIRSRLTGDAAKQATTLLLEAAPACTRTETDIIRTIASGGDDVLPICKSEDETLYATSYNILVNWLNIIGAKLPAGDTTFADFWQISRDNARALNLFVQLNFQFISLTYLCPLGLLSLVVFLAVRSLKGFGAWAGVTALITGIGVLLMLLLLRVVFASFWIDAMPANELEVLMRQVFSSILLSVLAQSSAALLLQSALFIGLGFVLLVTAWLVRMPHRAAGTVLITEDGQIISTASQQRSKTLRLDDDGEF